MDGRGLEALVVKLLIPLIFVPGNGWSSGSLDCENSPESLLMSRFVEILCRRVPSFGTVLADLLPLGGTDIEEPVLEVRGAVRLRRKGRFEFELYTLSWRDGGRD